MTLIAPREDSEKTRAFQWEPLLWFALPLVLAIVLNPGWIEGRGHPDEDYHLKILAESIAGDTLAFPTLSGKPWFTKPPLLIWLAAAIDALTGWGARAGIRLVALAGWAASYALVYSILRLSLGSIRRASLQALAVVSLFGVFWFSRIGMMDLPLLANLLAGCVLARRWAESRFAPGPALLLALVLSLGGWWKGPVFYPLMVIPFFTSIEREQWREALRALLRTWYLWVVVLLVGNAWILINLYKYEWVYFRKFFLRENLSRLRGARPLRLMAYFALGLFPFWVPLVQTLRRPLVWLQQASARIGVALAVSTLLVFGMGSDKHFHWFIPAFVGLGLVPWSESAWRPRMRSRMLNTGVTILAAGGVLSFLGAAFWKGIDLGSITPVALLGGALILLGSAALGRTSVSIPAWALLFTGFLYDALPGGIRIEARDGFVCEAVPVAATAERAETEADGESVVKFRGGLTPVGRELKAMRENPGVESLEAFLNKITVTWRCLPTKQIGPR